MRNTPSVFCSRHAFYPRSIRARSEAQPYRRTIGICIGLKIRDIFHPFIFGSIAISSYHRKNMCSTYIYYLFAFIISVDVFGIKMVSLECDKKPQSLILRGIAGLCILFVLHGSFVACAICSGQYYRYYTGYSGIIVVILFYLKFCGQNGVNKALFMCLYFPITTFR